jgi:urease accessory protein
MLAAATPAQARLPSIPPPVQWYGSLDLSLAARAGATRIVARRHAGPLLIQRPFYPEGAHCCHIYLLHPPGGLVGGDQLDCRFTLGRDSHGLITTPSAGKAYRVDAQGREQGQHADIDLAEGAILEWLPQENIAFNGAQLSLGSCIHFHADSSLLGWDILCLGRPAAGEEFTRGQVRQRLELWCEGRPKLLELAEYRGGSPIMGAPWGLANKPVTATLYAYWPAAGGAEGAVHTIRQDIAAGNCQGLCEATVVNDILLVRYLGNSTEEVRCLFTRLWQRLRPLMINRKACPPRIWNT